MQTGFTLDKLFREQRLQLLGTVKTDKKHRISLLGAYPGSYYKIYRNIHGQFLLDPQRMIPAVPTWPRPEAQ